VSVAITTSESTSFSDMGGVQVGAGGMKGFRSPGLEISDSSECDIVRVVDDRL